MPLPQAARLRAAACVTLAAAAALAGPPEEPGRFEFDPPPDDFRADALLDLRALNEPVAGASGFVGVDANGDFVLGDGSPARFWSVNTAVARKKPWTARPRWSQIEPDLGRHARFLAKRGVNMVRLHARLNPDPDANPGARLADVHAGDRDWIWRTVAAMKKEGIYVTVSPYWANTMKADPAWGLGWTDAHAMLFFDERLQAAYRAWLRALLSEVNPHTGVPLAKDPALAIVQIQNEDSLLFWTLNHVKGEPRRRIGRAFAAWAARRHGSVAAALTAWDDESLPGDDPDEGVLDLSNLWHLTAAGRGGNPRRHADQTRFLAETMREFHAGIVRYLREDLGCRQLVNAGNWKTADDALLGDAERWTYAAADVVAVNRYLAGVHTGPNVGWAIGNGDCFTSPSVLRDAALDLPVNLRQVRGRPTIVTESSWTMPGAHAAEGPFLVAAYASLTGVDSYYWFATNDEGWSPPQSANGYMPSQQKWMYGSPDVLGSFPAAALAFRKAYVKRGEPVVVEERTDEDLWNRRSAGVPERSGFDPNRDEGSGAPRGVARSTIPPQAFLAGPVVVEFGAKESRTRVSESLAKLVLDGGRVVKSVTGEIELDTRKGRCTLDAPKAQGVAGFLRGQGEVALSSVRIRCGNEYAVVLVVALDDLQLATSRRVLVQVTTPARPTGWREEPCTIDLGKAPSVEGFRVTDYGRAPWQVVRPDLDVSIANPALTRATALDANGNAAGPVAIERSPAGVRFVFPPDRMYVVLE